MTSPSAAVPGGTAGPDDGPGGEAEALQPGADRILTLPNVISAVRLLCLPLFLYLLFGRDNRAGAAGLLGALGATDWIDGFIARRWNQVSTVGKVLDPVADRLLFFVGIVAIVIDGSVPIWIAVAVLAREVLVTAATLGMAALGARRVDVTWWGKAGTFLLMWAFPMFLASESTVGWRDAGGAIAWACAIPGLVAAYVSLGLYFPIGLAALREGRAGRPS